VLFSKFAFFIDILNVDMLIVVMLSVVILSVIMLSAPAPHETDLFPPFLSPPPSPDPPIFLSFIFVSQYFSGVCTIKLFTAVINGFS
jgi:hypothetical protein